MPRRVATVLLVVFAVLASWSCARKERTNVLLSASPASFGDAPGSDIAQRRCLACHSANLTTQQHKDSTAWSKTIAQMETWSAPIDSTERDSLLDYLVARYGPRPAP